MEEWLVFVVMGLGVLDEKRLGVFSLFSVMLMGTPGIGRAGFLWFLVIGSVLFLVSCYFYCFFR